MIVTSWLINSVSKDIAASIMYIDSAKHIWTDLHERFTQSNGPHIYHTQKNFATFTQDSASVNNYFTKLKMYWDKLQSYCSIDTCLCGFECKATKSIVAGQECELILQILMGLDDKFSNVHRQILLSDPIPSINQVFLLLFNKKNNSVITLLQSLNMLSWLSKLKLYKEANLSTNQFVLIVVKLVTQLTSATVFTVFLLASISP